MSSLKNSKAATNLVKLGLNKKQMALFFDVISEQSWQKSIDLYKNLEIIRNTLDEKDKFYVLLRGEDKKGYDVNLEIMNDKLVSFCSCSNREKKGCEHAGCALLVKLLEEDDNDFKSVLCEQEKYSGDVAKPSDLDYFKDLMPKKIIEDRRYMIYFNFEEFNLERQILSIERGVIKKKWKLWSSCKISRKEF